MSPYKKMPSIKSIFRLAKEVDYPANTRDILKRANDRHYSKSIMQFILLFPLDDKFYSAEEFINRCESLEFLMHQELDTPAEPPLSPQD